MGGGILLMRARRLSMAAAISTSGQRRSWMEVGKLCASSEKKGSSKVFSFNCPAPELA